ncbi:MAG: hypothetical protein KatS3mg061_2875 [Dehalococcoidia bacterium]|nr:MAG: hypothetical protein KatS3mg061_2875 [Dehalococcoidia bacterium]
MLFRSSAPLAPGDWLRFALPLEGQEPVAVTLTVIAEAGEGHYRGYFSGLSEADVQRIVRYVFAREIEERKRRRASRSGSQSTRWPPTCSTSTATACAPSRSFSLPFGTMGSTLPPRSSSTQVTGWKWSWTSGEHHQFRAIITVLASLDDPLTAALGHRTGRLHYRGRFTVIDEREQRWIQERLALQARTPAS